MRSHGFPTFPDPNAQGGFTDLPSNANPGSPTPQYTAANTACQSALGGHGLGLSPARQAQLEANGLKFAQCMRSHGVPNYPDPTFNFSGGGVSQKVGEAGLSPTSPIFQRSSQSGR
jgi:hypothetical protein